MVDNERRLIDRLLDPSYTQDVGSRKLEDLRAMREECREAENEFSFERRLCHARIDILTAELERRQSGLTDSEFVAHLPQILADGQPPGVDLRDSPLPWRAPDFSLPRSADVQRQRVDEIVGEETLARLTEAPPEEIKGIIESLARHERELSTRRSGVHGVMDVIQGEIVRRYTSGEADPTAALS
ncbi:hypothetical protein BH20ACT22_BH20ACT22_21570 [soil metagenome]